MKRWNCLVLALAMVLALVPGTEVAAHPFADVGDNSWYAEAVEYVYRSGLMDGVADGIFSPNTNMSRCMIVTVLHRMEGKPTPSGASPFDDVPTGTYYTEAVDWSYENGIVDGVSDTKFAPDANVTRQQLVTIFYRYAKAKGYTVTDNADLSRFIDGHRIASYACDALIWAVAVGIIDGVTENTLEPDGNATRAQFSAIIQRFAAWQETRNAPATVLTAEKDAQLRASLQTAIDGILDTETQIRHSDTFIPGETYTGTAYYFSNDGDDFNNDGLSPEHPWQSVGKLLGLLDARDDAILKPGDAVFLRRGDTFRLPDWALDVSVEGVTISAYGEGGKPILTASSENGSGGEKWKLVYEDATGKKIWQFYKDIRDTSMVIFNDGEEITKRVYEFYDGANYISCEDTYWWMHDDKGVTLLDGLLPLEESLTENLTIISRAKSPDTPLGESERGPLYLRCDEGNPGILYDSIEFTELDGRSLFWLEASDFVLDNLSLRCNGNSFVKCDQTKPGHHWVDIENTVIQNCEFAYGGGSVWEYMTLDSGGHIVVAQGDGIYTVVKNTTIRNNYFHDCMSTVTTYELALDDNRISGGYYHVLDNVMVKTAGIRLDSTSNALKYLDSVIVRGNQVWETGAMDSGKIYYSEGALVMMPNQYGECIVEDNVFYTTENGHPMNALLDIFLYDFANLGYARPRFVNNTYVQYAGRNFGDFLMHNGETWAMGDPELLNKAAQWLGDTTSEFYVIE